MGFYKGQGGVVWELTPPQEGTMQRERFDEQVANGFLVEVDPPETDEPKPAKAAATKKAAAS